MTSAARAKESVHRSHNGNAGSIFMTFSSAAFPSTAAQSGLMGMNAFARPTASIGGDSQVMARDAISASAKVVTSRWA